jgi:hypothetical protein
MSETKFNPHTKPQAKLWKEIMYEFNNIRYTYYLLQAQNKRLTNNHV